MKQVQNCFVYILKCYTFENVTSVLAVVYVLLGRAVKEYRWGGSGTFTFMCHEFLVLTFTEIMAKLKPGYHFFEPLCTLKTHC